MPCGVAQLDGLKGEDAVACVPSFTGDEDDDFWVVLDGHRSRDVAQHAARALHEHLRRALDSAASPAAALADAFLSCHRNAQALGFRGGACALCFVTLGGQGWCANAGDCRAVLSRRDGHAERLSTDHKARDPAEVARIEACGGAVELGCLDGELAVSRGIGNFDFGPSFSQTPAVAGPIALGGGGGRVRVSSAPPTLPSGVGVGSAELLLLASDGVFDVLSDAEASALLRGELRRGATLDDACEALLTSAAERGSADDKTAVLLCLPGGGEAATTSAAPVEGAQGVESAERSAAERAASGAGAESAASSESAGRAEKVQNKGTTTASAAAAVVPAAEPHTTARPPLAESPVADRASPAKRKASRRDEHEGALLPAQQQQARI